MIETGLAQGSSSGYDAEARFRRAGDDASIAGAARYFLCQYRGEKRSGSDAPPGPLNSVGILGGRLMVAVSHGLRPVKADCQYELRI